MSSEVPKCEHGANQVCAPCNREFKRLKDIATERDAALSRSEEAERQLCRARKAINNIKKHHIKFGSQSGALTLIGMISVAYDALDAALSSTSPCPHEARIRQLEEVMVNAAFATFRLLEISAPPAAGMNHILKMAGKTKTYSDPDEAKAELRRKPDKKGG